MLSDEWWVAVPRNFVIGCVFEITAKSETELMIYSDAAFGYCFWRTTNNTENRAKLRFHLKNQ